MLNKQRLISTFLEMVQIDSQSGDEQGFANYLIQLASNLNLECKKDKYNNVYIYKDGIGEPLMLNTHMDTVSPGKGIKPIVEGDYIKTDGSTVLGADSKAGIAAMIEAVRTLQELKIKHRPLELTFSCNEESGLPTAPYIQSKAKECIVADRGTPLGEVIHKAPFAQVFEINVNGKTAYATTSFDEGRHAVLAAARMINLLPIGNYKDDATANIGIVKGGFMTTMVPEYCYIKGNCYSFSKESLYLFFQKLEEIVKMVDKEFGTNSEIKMLEYFGGYSLDKSDPLVQYAASAIKEAGLESTYKVYKAVTNANNLNEIGIKSVLISTGVENQHTTNEKIKLATLETLTKILLNAAKG